MVNLGSVSTLSMLPRDRSISKLNPVSAYLIFSPYRLPESVTYFLINHDGLVKSPSIPNSGRVRVEPFELTSNGGGGGRP
jgi:hypothetical protein